MFGIIWLVVGLCIAFFGLFEMGRTGNIDYIGFVVAATLWPFVILAAAVFSPFVAIYYLGKSLRK